jgi:hypothetical protein
MGDTPPDGGKRPVARPRAQPRSFAQRRRRKRWDTLIVGCGMLVVALATTVMVIAAEYLISRQLSRAPQVASAAPDADRTARITKDFGGKDCSQEIFNNQTGRTTRSPQPCDATALDGNGAPIPLGTIHRLDAISKSFPGN